ncbi:MAG: tetratricopeptide repeat protein, partial [Betaproteobacteria bacterium]
MLKRLMARLAGEAPAQALIDAGHRAESAGQLADACRLYRQAVAAAPRFARAHLNLGAALEASGDAAGAERAYAAVLEFDPANPYASYNLGNLAAARGDAAAAERLVRRALESKPEFPEAYVALANALEQGARREQALDALRAALAQRPQYIGAWFNCALLLRQLQRPDEAEDALRRVLELDRQHLDAYRELGALLRGSGRVEEALHCYRSAPAAVSAAPTIESASLLTALYADSVADSELFSRHRAFAERLAKQHAPHRPTHAGAAQPQRRLRIGYVSDDFCLHPAAAHLLPVLARHDRSAFEVHCYMTGPNDDHVTAEARELADRWHDAAPLDDAMLADAVRDARIDVLVDLIGHAGRTRLGAFARRPAPVQV